MNDLYQVTDWCIFSQFVERIKKYCDINGGPATFIQAAVPDIVEQTQEVFFRKTINILKQTSDICYQKIEDINGITCPTKPKGAMAFMVSTVARLATH